MKVLITGSSGFLGRIMTDHLISGNTEVIGIDVKPRQVEPEGNFRFYSCSIEDKEKLQAIFQTEQPTHVLHFACTFNKVRNKKREHEIDITGSRNIQEISEKTLSVKQLIFSSSAVAYGGKKDNKTWISESDPLLPGVYSYGVNKKTIEKMYFENTKRQDLHIVALRICLVIGPAYDKPRSVVSLLIKFPYLPGFTKNNRLQFLHTEDLTSLMGLILADKDISGIYNLAPDSSSSVRELVPDKKYLNIPYYFAKGLVWVFWHLRIMNLQPASIKDARYPVIIDPAKLISRYNYRFAYTTKEAFEHTVFHNKLPENIRF